MLLSYNISQAIRYFIKIILISMAVLLIVQGCNNKKDDVTGDDGGNGNGNEEVHKYLNFKVTCGNPAQPTIVGVAIYNQYTGTRLIRGSTTASGNFYCVSGLDVSWTFRIELYDIPDRNCIMWIKDITYSGDPIFWVDNYDDVPKATIHLGGDCDNISTTSGCWGN